MYMLIVSLQIFLLIGLNSVRYLNQVSIKANQKFSALYAEKRFISKSLSSRILSERYPGLSEVSKMECSATIFNVYVTNCSMFGRALIRL